MAEPVSIFPANDFKVVAINAAEEVDVGIIMGYDAEGNLTVYAGGMLNGRQPTAKDWLWIVESFKRKLLNGDYCK